MSRALFSPFDLKKWFVIGFTAFLAGLADIEMSGGFPDQSVAKRSKFDVEEVLYFPQRAWEWLLNHPGWAVGIAIGAFLLCVLVVVVTWISARGKFMFLDNVVHNRSRVAAPWREYRKEGNSFFWWNILWVILFSILAIAYLFYCFRYLQALYEGSMSTRMLILPAALAVLGFIAIAIMGAFIYVLLRDFIVPIMYRDRSTATQAVQKFLLLFSSQFPYFIGYGLFLLCLSIPIVIGILIFGCVTCCVGFVVLSIPYLNAVILLPISYSIRAFGVEFLEQFGPEFRIFPQPDAKLPDAPPVIS